MQRQWGFGRRGELELAELRAAQLKLVKLQLETASARSWAQKLWVRVVAGSAITILAALIGAAAPVYGARHAFELEREARLKERQSEQADAGLAALAALQRMREVVEGVERQRLDESDRCGEYREKMARVQSPSREGE